MSEWKKYHNAQRQYLLCEDGDVQVEIYDGNLELSASVDFVRDGARMTPTQARMVAAKLIDLADELEKQGD